MRVATRVVLDEKEAVGAAGVTPGKQGADTSVPSPLVTDKSVVVA